MRRDRELLGELAVAEDFHLVGHALDEAHDAERRLVDGLTVVEGLEVADVDFGHGVAERVAKPALGNATLNRALTALEPETAHAAGRAGFLPFLPTTSGLAEAGADPATSAGLLGVRANGGAELGKTVRHRFPRR